MARMRINYNLATIHVFPRSGSYRIAKEPVKSTLLAKSLTMKIAMRWQSMCWLKACCRFALTCVCLCDARADEHSGAAIQIAPSPTEAMDKTASVAAVESLIEQFSSPSFAARRQAVSELWQLGSVAEEPIKQAQLSDDKQVAELARQVGILIKVSGQVPDITTAREVAKLFLDASDENLLELASRGYWHLAHAFLDEHHGYAVRAQESFFQQANSRQLIQKLVQLAIAQGDVKLAWPVVSHLMPDELAAWTAAKLQLPLPRPASDDHQQAVRLFLSGQVQEALQQKISPQLKSRLAVRGFQWSELSESAVQQAILGQETSIANQAAHATLTELIGAPAEASQLWQNALGLSPTDEPTSINPEQELVAATEALHAASDSARQESSKNQLLLSLMLSGRVAAIERYFQESSPQAAFEFFMVRSEYGQAFQQLGLEPKLTNFDSWLADQRKRAQTAMADYNASSTQDLRELAPAITLGHVGSSLVGLGYRNLSMQILEFLVRLGQQDAQRPNPIWEKCILRWIGRDEWRACCLEIVDRHLDLLPDKQKASIFSKLYSELDDNAYRLFLHAPAMLQAGSIDIALALEQLDHLERCDRDYFGQSARQIVESWLYRAQRELLVQRQMESEQRDSSLTLAKLARDWGMSELALHLLDTSGDRSADRNQRIYQAAEICIDQRQAQLALEFLDQADPSLLDQHWQAALRIKALLLLGQLEAARQVQRAQWMQLGGVSWNGDRSAGYRATDDLMTRSLWESALPYCERNFALDRFMNYYFGFWEARQYSRVLQELNDFHRSADVMRSVFVELLKPNSQTLKVFIDNDELGLLRFMAVRERLSRGIALINLNDYPAARHELEIAAQLHPLDIEVVVACYPKLIKAEQNEWAEQLFSRYQTAMKSHLETWPDDAMTANNLAWMYCQCDLHLDQALSLAQQAVRLAPSSAVYLDTLAETQFRLGQINQAIQSMRGCVRLSPREPHYRDNLARYSAAR